MGIAMLRGTIIAVVLLGMGMAAGPSQAQHRAKSRFPGAPQQGYASGNQNRGAYFNPKELSADKKNPWQKGQSYPHQGGMFFGRGPFQHYPEGGVTGFTRKVIGVNK
jgi:hypothetical protein